MNENISTDYLNKRLDFINDDCLNKLNEMENNFNNLKDTFYELTKQYENKKTFPNNNNFKDLNKEEESIIYQINEMITHLLSEERNNNINYINSCLNKYNMNKSLLEYNEQNSNKDYIKNFENELKQMISQIDEKIDNIKMEKSSNIQAINIEMNNEINNLIKKINDTSLNLISSNSDKAKAIQDIIKIYLNKFKVSKNDYNEFEDKITNLISELLDKVVLLKRGQ